jgi:hypothetical protein
MENKDLNNDHTAIGMPPSSKSRSKRTPVARAHHYRSRLNNAATPIPQGKRLNALKHGIFAINPTIPGADCEGRKCHSSITAAYNSANSYVIIASRRSRKLSS